jgi:hypothetical protein
MADFTMKILICPIASPNTLYKSCDSWRNTFNLSNITSKLKCMLPFCTFWIWRLWAKEVSVHYNIGKHSFLWTIPFLSALSFYAYLHLLLECIDSGCFKYIILLNISHLCFQDTVCQMFESLCNLAYLPYMGNVVS